jgi:hypothetical protein
MLILVSLPTLIVKQCVSLPCLHPSKTTESVMGGSTGAMSSGTTGGEGSRDEEDEARAGEGDKVFFFREKKPIVREVEQ